MKDRIKKIRKRLKITQEEFGKRIGLARNSIASYETGRREPTNSVIVSICREFNVNELWLRTGEGGDENIFTKVSREDRFSINLGKLSLTQNEYVENAVNYLAETDPEKLKIVVESMKQILGIIDK